MKTTLITLLGFLFISFNGFAQHAFLKISGGYALPTTTSESGVLQNMGGNGQPTSIGNVRSELGSGVPLSVRAGYMITNHVGADIGFNYLVGNRVNLNSINAGNESLTVHGQTRQSRLNPAIIFSTGSDLILSAYSRLGLVLPLGGVTTLDTNVSGAFTTEGFSISQTEEIQGRINVGFSGAMGAQYHLYERMHIFAEVEAIHLGISRGSGEITRFRVADQDALETLPLYSRQTNYVNQLTPTSNNNDINPNSNQNEPRDVLTSTTFFNSIGLNIGIKYRIF